VGSGRWANRRAAVRRDRIAAPPSSGFESRRGRRIAAMRSSNRGAAMRSSNRGAAVVGFRIAARPSNRGDAVVESRRGDAVVESRRGGGIKSRRRRRRVSNRGDAVVESRRGGRRADGIYPPPGTPTGGSFTLDGRASAVVGPLSPLAACTGDATHRPSRTSGCATRVSRSRFGSRAPDFARDTSLTTLGRGFFRVGFGAGSSK